MHHVAMTTSCYFTTIYTPGLRIYTCIFSSAVTSLLRTCLTLRAHCWRSRLRPYGWLETYQSTRKCAAQPCSQQASRCHGYRSPRINFSRWPRDNSSAKEERRATRRTRRRWWLLCSCTSWVCAHWDWKLKCHSIFRDTFLKSHSYRRRRADHTWRVHKSHTIHRLNVIVQKKLVNMMDGDVHLCTFPCK